VVMMRLIINCGNKESKMRRYEPNATFICVIFLETKAVNEYLAAKLLDEIIEENPFSQKEQLFSFSSLDFRHFDSRRRCLFLSAKG